MFEKIKIWLLGLINPFPQIRVKEDYQVMLKKLKKLELQVQEKADQVEKVKTSFLKNVYHEIRTPLNSIIGFTNLLSRNRNLSATEKEEYLNLVNESSNEFLRIMDDIIQAALLEAEMVKIIPETCRLDTFFENLYVHSSNRKHVLGKYNIVLIKSIPAEYEDLEIYCDHYRLNQVMSHLLDNALKFSDKGVVEFGFRVKNKNIEFYVKDSSESKILDKEKFIFNRFSKIEIVENSKSGLGLGLSICKDLVELMDGKIWFSKNISKKGSCFHVSLPLQINNKIPETQKRLNGEKSFFNLLLGVQKTSVS